ncbi:hypothetical protein ACERII_13290 [Evansella sp. AB-rgal1]|uniref:hypothetical protein n=1 Tax=Evansella sp. AB-rgal1 TaxID=3242696 RepID=UPI00359EC6F2
MYIQPTFEASGVFTLLRPIFFTLLIVALFVFIVVIVPKLRKALLNGFAVLSLGILSIFLSAQILFYTGIIVDEINLGGDPVTFYSFFVIAGIWTINLIVYLYTVDKK